MGVVVDDVDVCNLALDHLKQAAITNIQDATTGTEGLMARQFPQARRAVLRMHPWNFGKARVGLTPSPDKVPVVGYTQAYKLPLDFLRFLYRLDIDGQVIRSEYDLEGGYLLMDGDADSTVYISYIKDVTSMALWDPLAVDMLALNLALRISSKFAGTEARAASIRTMLVDVKSEARAIDGQERPPRKREYSAFLAARRGFIGRNSRDQRYTYFP